MAYENTDDRRWTRREALRLAGAAGLGLVSASAAPGRAQARSMQPGTASPASRFPPIPSWNTELRKLTENVYAYTQATGPGVNNASLSNAGVIVGPDGLLAIDALGPPVHAKAFRAAAMQATGKSFHRVINTHQHRDHTNGNCFFLPAEIVAHVHCRQAVIDQGIPDKPYPDRPQWQDGMSELTLAPPTTTIDGNVTYRYGDLVVEVMTIAPAHTWGDLMVHLPQHRILFSGDLSFFYVTPPAHNGHISKWIEAIDKVNTMDVDVIVPGHGPIGTKRELMETREYLVTIRREMRKRYDAGMRPGQAAADIDMGRFENWTNPERNAWNAVRLYAEFSGTITPATDVKAQDEATAEYWKLRSAAG